MKNLFSVFGIVLPAIIVVFAVFYGVIIYQGIGVDETSKAYVDEVTPIILSSMNRETLFSYADDELINSARAEDIDRVFNLFKSLGELRKYNGSSGKASVKMKLSGISFTAYYEADASFEKGKVLINVSTVKHGDTWKITGFRMSSSVLTP